MTDTTPFGWADWPATRPTVELPALRAGRHWEVEGFKSTPRKRTADRTLVRLCARTGRVLGYFAQYDNGWGINVATARGFKSAGGVYASGERAAAALLKELAR